MTARVIISYDDTPNDQDALALGRVLGQAGADLSLAYVRHSHESDPRREEREEREARALLARGAEALGDSSVERHVVVSGSTGDGLAELAEREGADIVVFGSDYRTAPRAVRPGRSAQRLLDGGPAAVAIAPAAFRERDPLRVRSVGVLPEQGDAAAAATARSLAAALGADEAGQGAAADLLVVASRPEAPHGHVTISAATEYAIETADSPVLVLPGGVTLDFGVTLAVTH